MKWFEYDHRIKNYEICINRKYIFWLNISEIIYWNLPCGFSSKSFNKSATVLSMSCGKPSEFDLNL